MDNELYRMQQQASRICDVELRRIEKPPQKQSTRQNDDSILLLALILILAIDKADRTLIMMLLYIFAT